MMRAAVLRDRAFAVEDRPQPVPGPGQVLLKTRLCGICGSDLHLAKHLDEIVRLGEEMGAPPQDLSNGLVLGHEFVGEIVAFGPDTQRVLPIGARVCSVPFLLEADVPKPIGASAEVGGAYAEYMLASEILLLPIPDSLPDAGAALVEPFAIGMHAVAKAGVAASDAAAIVLGCGPIGLAVTAVLRMKGAKVIVATDFSPKRRELAGAMGATEVLDPRQSDPFAAVAAAAPGQPCVIYDCTGARGVLGRTIRQSPSGARIVVAGIAHGEESIDPMIAISRELTIQFVVYYSPEEFAETLTAVAAGALDWRPLVTATIGLAAIPDAFRALEDPETHAKILIDPWGDGVLV